MTGRLPSAVAGIVIPGRRLGRRLGVPTANLALAAWPEREFGSYAAIADVAGRRAPALAHAGVRPSVGGGLPLLEVHVLDFAGDLYGQAIGVTLLARLSGEERLESLHALEAKIHDDLRRVRRFFQGR